METIGVILAIVGVAAFGYFVYTRVQKSKERQGGSGGGRPGNGSNTNVQ